MDALASPVLVCSGIALFHHAHGLFSGMVCSVSLARDRTSLSLSYCCQSTPAPAGQVAPLRWMCGNSHHSRDGNATADLPFAWASWLVLSACRFTCLSCHLVHLPALLRSCHSALRVLGHRYHHASLAGL